MPGGPAGRGTVEGVCGGSSAGRKGGPGHRGQQRYWPARRRTSRRRGHRGRHYCADAGTAGTHGQGNPVRHRPPGAGAGRGHERHPGRGALRGRDRGPPRPHRHPGDLRGQLARRVAGGSDRRPVDVQPEPEVHGLRPHGARRHRADARAGQRFDRAGRRERRAQAQLLGDDRGRGERGGHQLRVVGRRAVRAVRGKDQHGEPGPGEHRPVGHAGEGVRPGQGRKPGPGAPAGGGVDPVRPDLQPAEVAALVTFLASPRASFINGAHIPVDGAQRKAIMDR